MKTNWPQITMIIIMAMELLVHARRDKEPREARYDFSVKVMETAILVWLTWAGGFWS